MNHRRKLLVFSIFVLASVAMAGVGITAFHCFAEAAQQDAAGQTVAITWRSLIGSGLITAVVIVAGGTILVRVVNPFIRLLETTKQQLEWKAAELDHFMQALSHDMSANSMLMQSSFEQLQAACKGSPAPAIQNNLTHIDACLQQSQRFLDDLRELTRTGSVQMEPTAVPLAETVQEVLFEQADLLAERQVEVIVEPGLETLWCNGNRVKQVVTNLVRNAVKHGCDAKRPRITIGRGTPPAELTKLDLAWLRVDDNGQGIPATQRQEIFLPGKRLPSADPDGTGMGLAIVKKVVEHYAGRVLVDGRASGGASFVCGLPRASREQMESSAAARPRRPRRRHYDSPAATIRRGDMPIGR